MTTTPTNLGAPWRTPSSRAALLLPPAGADKTSQTSIETTAPAVGEPSRSTCGGSSPRRPPDRHSTTNEETAMTTTTIRRTTGERSAPADGNILDERPGFPGRGRSAHPGAARLRPVRRHAGHLDRQRGASVDPGRSRARRCRRHVDRERVRRRLRRPAAAVRTTGRPVRPTRHVHRGLGPVHRRHAAGSRGRGPGNAVGGPRRPGRRRRRTQPRRHVAAHAGLPRSSTSQGHEHLGRRLDAGRSHGRRARAVCSPAPWVGGRCSS